MTAEDSVYIPFPGTVLKNAEIVSTINLITSYEKSVTGCYNHCPCRVWQQCSYYNKMKWKKSRGNDDEHLDEIRKWYDTHFRIKFETPDAFPNG